MGTNCQIGYQNYISHYAEKLRSLGAEMHKLGNVGEMIILKNTKN